MHDTATDSASAPVKFERDRGVYAIDLIRHLAHAVVKIAPEGDLQASFLRVLRILADHEIPIFCVKFHRSAITLSCAEADVESAERALVGAGMSVEIRCNLCLVAVRAAAMRDLYGVMSGIADALSDAKATIYATIDSHNSVQCLIEEIHLDAALLSLRNRFDLPESAVCENIMEGDV